MIEIYESIARLAIKQAHGNARELRRKIANFESADGFTKEGRQIILIHLRKALENCTPPKEYERSP